MPKFDPIEKAEHYNSHPSGVECVDIAEWFPALLFNAWKYLHRQNHKGTPLKDLEKSRYYVRRERRRRGIMARRGQVEAFFCPVSLPGKVSRFMAHESGLRRELFSALWSAVNRTNETAPLRDAEVLLDRLILDASKKGTP